MIFFFREQMPYTYENQLTYEKTPSYFTFDEAPKRIYDFNSKIKLILIIRDPVIRAISQFTHSLVRKSKIDITRNNKYDKYSRMFENQVLDNNGSVSNDESAILSPGKYNRSYEKWLKYFSNEQILVLNGENFIVNPYEEIIKVEKFLNLKPFFQKGHFTFDEKKGFFCINKNLDTKQAECLKDNKGRMHPFISEETIDKLRKYYEPYNKKLFDLIGVKPFW